MSNPVPSPTGRGGQAAPVHAVPPGGPLSPFAALTDPARVLAAAERAARLDLPRRRSTSWNVREEDETDEDEDLAWYRPPGRR